MYSQCGTLQQSHQQNDHLNTSKGAALGSHHSKNNLSNTTYYTKKPPLNNGTDGRMGTVQGQQVRVGSQDGATRSNNRLNQTLPLSSQKKISKQRVSNAPSASSTKKINRGKGGSSSQSTNQQKGSKISIQRIIDSSQKVANMTINLNPQIAGPPTLGVPNGAMPVSNQIMLQQLTLNNISLAPQNKFHDEMLQNYNSVFRR